MFRRAAGQGKPKADTPGQGALKLGVFDMLTRVYSICA